MGKKIDFSGDSNAELDAYAASYGALARELAPTDNQEERQHALDVRAEAKAEQNRRAAN